MPCISARGFLSTLQPNLKLPPHVSTRDLWPGSKISCSEVGIHFSTPEPKKQPLSSIAHFDGGVAWYLVTLAEQHWWQYCLNYSKPTHTVMLWAHQHQSIQLADRHYQAQAVWKAFTTKGITFICSQHGASAPQQPLGSLCQKSTSSEPKFGTFN